MNESNPTPSVTVKKRNILSLVEYCLENKIDFTIKSKPLQSDEFDVEFIISNTKKAIDLGLGHGIVAEGDVTMAFENALHFELGSSN